MINLLNKLKQSKKIYSNFLLLSTIKAFGAFGILIFTLTITSNYSAIDAAIIFKNISIIMLIATLSKFGIDMALLRSIDYSKKEKRSNIRIEYIIKIILKVFFIAIIFGVAIRFFISSNLSIQAIVLASEFAVLQVLLGVARGYQLVKLVTILEIGTFFTLGSLVIYLFEVVNINTVYNIMAVLILISITYLFYKINFLNKNFIYCKYNKPDYILFGINSVANYIRDWGQILAISFFFTSDQIIEYTVLLKIASAIIFIQVITQRMASHEFVYQGRNNNSIALIESITNYGKLNRNIAVFVILAILILYSQLKNYLPVEIGVFNLLLMLLAYLIKVSLGPISFVFQLAGNLKLYVYVNILQSIILLFFIYLSYFINERIVFIIVISIILDIISRKYLVRKL